MIDIAKFAIQSTADIQLKHPITHEPLVDGKKPVTVTLKSRANPEYRKAAVAFIEAVRADNASAEEKEAAAVTFLQAAIVGFSGINATAEDVSKPEYLWLREQIDAAIGDVSNFLPQ